MWQPTKKKKLWFLIKLAFVFGIHELGAKQPEWKKKLFPDKYTLKCLTNYLIEKYNGLVGL